MMMLATGWSWPGVIALAIIAGGTLVTMMLFATPFAKASVPAIGPARLQAMEEDLVAIREDLADIKETLAELDRLFKSVG
jgi:hypothetical protein